MVLADLRLAADSCTTLQTVSSMGLAAPMPQASPKAFWVMAALKEGATHESTELPPEVLRWLLADPLFVLSFHDPGPRIWRREELNWQECVQEDTDPFTHTAVGIDRRLTYGRIARYNLHRFVAKDATAMNEAIKISQRVRNLSDPVLSSNFGGYHSKRDLFRSEDTDSSGIEDFILAAVKAIERKDRATWESDGQPPEVNFPNPLSHLCVCVVYRYMLRWLNMRVRLLCVCVCTFDSQQAQKEGRTQDVLLCERAF